MADLSKLEEYIALVDRLVELADKNELADCARLLALNIAHYELLYGEMRLADRLAMTGTDTLNDQQQMVVINGMEILRGILVHLLQGLDKRSAH
ncbi:hypothetical protein [Nitrosovibrio tenuis]|uniref:Uncharacterized protein n=1 Tax=Nitrosovibrio tenuis TaxID=1233 RepID=A0A1H7RN08_9PROT|nr:hypothetical protein [Nitrosovibrio tenuis]SEL61204.1 hypothetical protein SAMN05216387_11816 [Nitrosovibrio tenuis]